MPNILQLAIHFLLSGVSVLIVAAVLPGMKVRAYGDAVKFSIIAALLNMVAWKALALVTVPFAILTAGIGYFIVNGLVFLLARKIVDGVQINGCFTAALAAAIVSFLNTVLTNLLF